MKGNGFVRRAGLSGSPVSEKWRGLTTQPSPTGRQQPEALRTMSVGTVPSLPASAGSACDLGKSQQGQGAGRSLSLLLLLRGPGLLGGKEAPILR